MSVEVVEVYEPVEYVEEVIEGPVEVVEVVERGPMGPAGPPGGASYTHTQSAPAATWVIEHNLGRRPAVTLFLNADPTKMVMTDIYYPDANSVIVEWDSAVSGFAYL